MGWPKRKRLTCGVLAAVLLVAVIVALVGVYVLTRDAPPPDDKDLRVVREDIPEEENAWHYFAQAAEKVRWPQEPEGREQTERVDAILGGEAWDEAFVSRLLDQNGEAIELWAEGVKRERCQVPPVLEATGLAVGVNELRQLSWLADLRSMRLLREGREREAFDQAMAIVRCGHLMEGDKGPLIHYLVGRAIKATGTERIRAMLPRATLEPDALLHYARELAAFGPHDDGLADAFRLEYEHEAGLVDDVVAGRLNPGKIQPPKTRGIGRLLVWHFFQPNRTKRLFADLYRACIRNVSRTLAEADWSGTPQFEEPQGDWSSLLRLMLRRNAVGHILVEMLAPAMRRAVELKHKGEVLVSITRVLLVLKARRAAGHDLPVSLEELVPEYIESVPRDPFDGRPIRYSRDRKILWSVGEDLKDDGGSKGEYPWEMPDPTFPIEF